jgi:hypothetical protein
VAQRSPPAASPQALPGESGLAADQELGEGAALRVAPELSDPVRSVEVGEAKDVDEFGASRRREGLETSPESRLNLLEGRGASVTG